MTDSAGPDLHATLKTRVNVAFILLWAALAGAMYWLSQPPPRSFLVVGLALGLIVGTLQYHSIHTHRGLFEQATNAIEVRRILVQSVSGKAAIAIQWLTAAILVSLWLVQRARPVFGVLCGYFAFMMARETLGLKAIIWLNRPSTPEDGAV